MATTRAEFQIYLFGASLGESIVLQLPDGAGPSLTVSLPHRATPGQIPPIISFPPKA